MDSKIVKARLCKASIKLPPVAGKTPRAEHIRVSKTKTKRRTKRGKPNNPRSEGEKDRRSKTKRATTLTKRATTATKR